LDIFDSHNFITKLYVILVQQTVLENSQEHTNEFDILKHNKRT